MDTTFEDQFKVVNQVRKITYPCLEILNGNREINQKHANKIKEALINGAKIPAILVDRKTKAIVDGQHRYEGFCLGLEEGYELTLEVIFDDYDDPVKAANVMNASNLNWDTKDYICSGIALNQKQYVILEQFCRTHKYLMWGTRPKYETAIIMLFGNTLSDGVKNLPDINQSNLDIAEVRYKIIEAIISVLGETNKVAFLKKGALKGLFKFTSEIESSEKLQEFILNGMNNRFSKPTKDGIYIWYQYYRNMYETYLMHD